MPQIRHIPPRRPSEFWERVQSLGVFGVVLILALSVFALGAAGFLLQMMAAFVAGALGI